MKNKYETPIITVDELEKVDVLLISEQTDNKHIESRSLFDINKYFSLKDIL